MSKYIQIDIRLIPFYDKGFVKQFPRIAHLLNERSYRTPLEEEVSLYAIVDYLVDITHEPGVPSDIKSSIAPYVKKLSALKEAAREQLLSRKLNELDQYLYRIEDQFEDLEKNL
jgi:hypothetical protein